MEKNLSLLFDRLCQKYGEICRVSDWQALQTAVELDQINAIIDQRETLLREIRSIETALQEAGAPDQPAFRSRVAEIKAIVTDIYESDKGMMNKISQRMNEIKEELKAKTLFRTRALPGYIKQKYAFSR